MSDAALPNLPMTDPLDASPEITEMVERLEKLLQRFSQDSDQFVLVTEGDGNVRDATLVEAAFWSNLPQLLGPLRRLGEREARMREVIRDNALTENLATRATAALPAYWQCNWCGGTGADANSIAHDGDCGVGAALAAGKEGE